MRAAYSIIAGRVGKRLKKLRGERTQSEFARLLGLKQSQYNLYETGKRLAPDGVVEKVARLSRLDPEEVVWGPVEKEQSKGPPWSRSLEQETADHVAELLRLLDHESLEDLYHYLRLKVEKLTRLRREEVLRAHKALESLRKKAL